MLEKIYYTKSVFEVDLRVVDNEGADGFLDETITVTVINTPPVAVAEFTTEPPYYESIEYSISAINSLDIDGTIELYEWDTDYDGITFNPAQSGEEIQVQWDTAGDYSIMLRVVDDDGAEDFLDEPLDEAADDCAHRTKVANHVGIESRHPGHPGGLVGAGEAGKLDDESRDRAATALVGEQAVGTLVVVRVDAGPAQRDAVK